ncbi:hypothetical protein TSEDIMI_40088 [Tenacibaculum sediminilitoris]|uniref:hypothetical protein n=1 Tax=Tenacibaculum sediminilitoris TaxID=1820334 RepID=UPI0038964142
MTIIDQNKILNSLELALESHSRLIDSRTEKDDFSFLVNFASLINFYDKTNTVNGDWSPFLLKDPTFLIASIAKTPYKKIHSLFAQTCITLEELLACKKFTSITNKEGENITNCFNQLFNQLIGIFHLVERWVHYMLESPLTYNLKDYTINQVKEKYSQFLWSLLWLKEQLYVSKQIKGITSVNKYFYNSFNPKIWKQSNIKVPYSELLELKYPLKENTECDFYNSLKTTGEIVFSFFNSIIEYSFVEFKNIKKEKKIFPDTLLLQTFTELMKIYKNQANGLTEKHLSFYYKDILRQKKQLAKADSVFTCADLSEITTPFQLKENTLFNAGEYADESTILFKTVNDVSLNPASISEAYTVTKKIKENGFSKLYKKRVKDVGTVKEDEDGNIESWKTFGSESKPEGKEVDLGFAIASPMLQLKEGNRELYLNFTFLDKINDLRFFEKGKYYLSTEEKWYPLPKENIEITRNSKSKHKVHFKITLEESAPSIVSFLENPDSIISSWPIFKMSYTELLSVNNPVKIKSLQIKVVVKEINSFQLYNDYGLLETEKPFQPLGPAPEKDQSFMIGNSEIFSKPLKTFSVELNWNNLPIAFTSYYQQYNRYLAGYYNVLPSFSETKERKETSFFSRVWPFSKKKKNIVVPVYNKPFNDECFKVVFQLQQNKQWYPVEMNVSCSFLDSLSVKGQGDTYKRELFQKVFYANIDIKIIDVLIIKKQLKVNELFTVKDILKVSASLKLNEELMIVDKLKIKGLLKIEERLAISDIIKIKDEVSFNYLKKNQEKLKVTELFELNEYLKISDVFLINEQVSVDNTLVIQEYLKNSTITLYKNHIVKSLDLEIKDQLLINTSLTIEDVFEINKDLIVSDLLTSRGKEIIRIKKEVTVNDLLMLSVENSSNEISYSGNLVVQNTLKKEIDVNIYGVLQINGEVSLENNIKIHEELNFQEVLEIDTEVIEKKNIALFEKIKNDSVFGSTKISEVQKDINPEIQNTLLEFNEETSTGFIRMQLIETKYGFGASLYSKIVSAIALYNADGIALNFKEGEIKYPLAKPANEPYTPVVGLFKGSYTSSVTYNFLSEQNEYPIQCFYYDVFKNYKVYDTNFTKKENKTIKNTFPALLPKVVYGGGLFLGLDKVIAPAAVSFYFELTQDYLESDKEKQKAYYRYLTKKGWKQLPLLSDTTSNYSCSGIVTCNIPSNITDVQHIMPNEKYWVCVAVKKNPDAYSKTTFLKTNGFKLERTGEVYKKTSKKPEIKANVIEEPHTAIPEIATIVQPFPSFGGKMAETEKHMNKRVSIRLKTKGRVVTSQDYYREIIGEFLSIYYVKTNYDKKLKKTAVYVVKKVQKSTDSMAFRPLVNQCYQEKIQAYLKNRASEFANIQVRNFKLTYVKIKGEVKITSGYKPEGVAQKINTGINIFLSPWITTSQEQITINKGVSVAQISEFIKSFKEIQSIVFLELYLGNEEHISGNIKYNKKPYYTVSLLDIKPSDLLVPSLNNTEITYT